MRIFLLVMLFLLCEVAAAQQAFRIGPWEIGDTREQVLAAEEFGPYAPVSATGGLETRRARFLDRQVTVSFVFDESDRIEYIQVWLYEGRSFRKAKKEALRVFDLFAAQFAGATIPGIKVGGSPLLDRESLAVILDRVLGQAPKLGEKFKKEQKIVATTVLDLVPSQQPPKSKLTAQLVHSSRHETFFIFLFEDQLTAPDRRAESNVQLEQL